MNDPDAPIVLSTWVQRNCGSGVSSDGSNLPNNYFLVKGGDVAEEAANIELNIPDQETPAPEVWDPRSSPGVPEPGSPQRLSPPPSTPPQFPSTDFFSPPDLRHY